MFHIVDSCPLSKLNGSLSQLHSADDEAVAWLTSYVSIRESMQSIHLYDIKTETQSQAVTHNAGRYSLILSAVVNSQKTQ